MMNVHAFRQEEFGGPEAMNWTTVDVSDPGPGEVMLRHTAVGLNMADVYRRSGLYPVKLPRPTPAN
ncbi:MAG: NADPH2:quinone reductase [Alphaproteobacteria bacterium]|jgi:NADPH2:quinone reductase